MPPGVVALILGEVVDEPIYGDVPLVQGLLVIGIIAAWHWVNSWLSYRSIWLDRLLGSGPTTLPRDGHVDARGSRREHVKRRPEASPVTGRDRDDVLRAA